jgi:vacuolar iron transporter family protein
MAGGTSQADVVLLAGVAGLVAGAGSMAAGEWVSVRSQRELYEHELAVEAWELEAFPDDERHELELIYRAKGLVDVQAAQVADAIMADRTVALDTLAREELGLDPTELGSPWTAAISSFLAFAVGAVVPLVPFLIAAGSGAVLASALVSGVALAGVGAAHLAVHRPLRLALRAAHGPHRRRGRPGHLPHWQPHRHRCLRSPTRRRVVQVPEMSARLRSAGDPVTWAPV